MARVVSAGHILRGETPVVMQTPVRGGQQFRHLFPDWIEPDVDSNMEVLWEDRWIIAVHKPAPLPVHPSGRFNRNTLTSLLQTVYQPCDLRVVHRLDANTTGVLLFARTAKVATELRERFAAGQIQKRYWVACNGIPEQESFSCDQPIAKERGRGGSRSIDPAGLSAKTDFVVLRQLENETAILEARPQTGRTHQIRIHLWALGLPVKGDPAYLKDRQIMATQTLLPTDPPMCLHAAGLQFMHPATEERIEIEGRQPDWLAQLA